MKTILITGVTSGIGKAFVTKYKSQANIVALGRDEEKLKELSVQYHVCDLANPTQIENIQSENIDVLINNAGVGYPTDLAEITPDDLNTMFDTNVKGLMLLTKKILPKINANGQILNLSSTAGLESNSIAPIYCATKFALEAYTQGLREQLRDKSIRVSAIRPDKVSTNYWGERKVPRDKFLSAEEVADCLWFIIQTPTEVNIKDITIESAR